MNLKIFRLAPVLLVFPLALAGCGVPKSASNAASDSPDQAPAPATLSNAVIATPLVVMARQVRAADSATAAAALSNRLIHVNDQRQIQVYIHVKALGADLQQTLGEAGATDILVSKPLGLYQAWVTPDALARIAALKAVTRITPPSYGFTRPTTH
ncbi:MAG: hypothetical protein L0I62_06395 [Gammaproteobacteria bacterium]|nr:hypothetical protein [Gammaproteobacteria bacterium]